MRVRIGSESEIQPGERKCVAIDGTEIVVVNDRGRYHAVRSFCPHMGGPVGRGAVFEDQNSPPAACEREGTTQATDDEAASSTIACPFHGWRFELETGAATFSEKKRVRTYDVETVEGDVYVDV